MTSNEGQSMSPDEVSADDEINLAEFWRVLLARKWLIIGITFLSAAASVFYARSLPDMYKSEALLAPAEQSDSNSLGRIAGQLGGLASLAGFNFRNGGSSKTAEALEILKSWSFIESFIQEQGIQAEVFAVKKWDKQNNSLVYNEEMFDSGKRAWLKNPELQKSMEPSSWQLYNRFTMAYLSVSTDVKTGFTTLSVEHYSPQLAEQWTRALIKKINRQIQERDISESEKNIAFLKQQIESTPVASMQAVFYQLLESQIKTLMLAKSTDQYIFRIVSEARAPEVKSKPQRAVIVIFGGIAGLLFGLIIAVFHAMSVKNHDANITK
jgi:LPS O-antigen subunit length determinant protein (WzzB/FepE family)